MKTYRLSTLVFMLVAISGCAGKQLSLSHVSNTPAIPEITQLQNIDLSDCSRSYQNKSIWVVEVYCGEAEGQSGIYLFDTSGSRYYQWYDQAFSQWHQSEGCPDQDSCNYTVKLDGSGRITELLFTFNINLSSGYYQLDSQGDSLEILDKEIIDSPS